MRNRLNLSGIFAGLGFLAGAAIVPAQSQMFEAAHGMTATMPSPGIIMLAMGLQFALLSFVMGWGGSLLSGKVKLKLASPFSLTQVSFAVLSGAGGMGLLLMMDQYIFLPMIPRLETVEVAWWKGLLGGVFYGGVFEEIAVRWFLMALIVWFFMKAGKDYEPRRWHYWAGIVISSLLFAVGHFPATAAAFGELSSALVVRGLLMNGALGVVFGYWFWKRGLVYSVIAHVSSHVFLYGIVKGLFQAL